MTDFANGKGVTHTTTCGGCGVVINLAVAGPVTRCWSCGAEFKGPAVVGCATPVVPRTVALAMAARLCMTQAPIPPGIEPGNIMI
ncbi:MAG: hypothetical protein WCT40_02800 [Candidatus Magasanikbacteria bacterium]|jgi:hypothetical protein